MRQFLGYHFGERCVDFPGNPKTKRAEETNGRNRNWRVQRPKLLYYRTYRNYTGRLRGVLDNDNNIKTGGRGGRSGPFRGGWLGSHAIHHRV